MATKFGNIVVAALALACVICSCKGPRVIPKDKFSKIYTEMVLGDLWLRDNYEKRHVADTSLFYEAIFAKYGYTTEDYRYSVNHYLRNPEEYRRILDKSILEVKKMEQKYDKLRNPEDSVFVEKKTPELERAKLKVFK